MKRCKFTKTRLVEYFVTNMRNTNLLGVNSKDLSESFCLIVTKFFFTTMSLVFTNLTRLHVSLAMICCKLNSSDAVDRFYGGGD